jgi:hypothetical protein
MKIKTKNLIEFFKKIKMEGTERIEEVVLDFAESGLKVSAITPTKTNRVDAIYNPSGFINYSAVGKIGIQDLNNIIKILGRFGEEVDIEVKENVITFKDGNKEMTTELVDIQFIKPTNELKNFEFDDMFTIDSKDINNMIDDANINKDYELQLSTVEKGFTIATTGKYKFKRNFVVEEARGGVTTTFGNPLINAVSNLTGKIVLNLKTNFPCKILEKTEFSVISILVSPKVKAN